MSEETFLFLDLETTGLDPQRCRILEVACVLTKSDFVPYAEFEAVVSQPINPADPIWEPVAWQMHHTSGLLAGAGTPDVKVSSDLFFWLARNLGTSRANLAGNSVHFDRGFLREHWPRTEWYLTHRHLDVSSLRLAGMAQGRPKPERGEAPHRAMADVRASLAELAYWLPCVATPVPHVDVVMP